jgi:hypothetical protein
LLEEDLERSGTKNTSAVTVTRPRLRSSSTPSAGGVFGSREALQMFRPIQLKIAATKSSAAAVTRPPGWLVSAALPT